MASFATQVQIRRGTDAENNAFTGAEGEVTMDLTEKTLRVHDGEKRGGTKIINENYYGLLDRKITNCVLQVPQNLNITFENGTVTLKAGSTVYVPNGAEAFDAINIESDVSVSSVQGGASGEITIYYNPNNNTLKPYSSSADDSGTSDPSSGVYTFYNTEDNLIKRIEDGSITYSGLSFPIAHVTANSGTITSLDEVFNGYGYIGFVVFTFPGMQYAIPNGRSSDGTLNNNTTIQTVVRTTTVISTSRTELYTSYLGLAAVAPGAYTYSYADNMLMAFDGTTRNYIFFGTLSMSSTQITGINPKYPIQVTDYWDFNKLVKEVDNAINDLDGVKTDLSNVSAEGIDTAVGWGLPDYSAGILVAPLDTIKITQPSCVQLEFYAYADTPIIITINGQSYNFPTQDAARYRIFYWLDTNDTIALGGTNTASITIFPLKGVENA